MRERLSAVDAELAEVESDLAAADLDPNDYARLGRRHARLREISDRFARWRAAEMDVAEAEELAAADPALADDLNTLAADRRGEMAELEAELLVDLVPADPDDDRDVIIEIRAAAGGDEAAIWAGDLLRMYERWVERSGLRHELIEATPSEVGGFSRVVLGVAGDSPFATLKYESGVHRVQRVPKTESQGRVHTSTATVAVLPEVDDVTVDIDPNDVRVDVFRSSGPGGQSVNTTDSAVRLTHLPTGLVVSCQDEKSQLQNKDKAFRILRARLYQLEVEKRQEAMAGARRSLVGSGERSEKIRTYNFKENRVTDHRVELTLYRLDAVLDGDLTEFVVALRAAEAAAFLAED